MSIISVKDIQYAKDQLVGFRDILLAASSNEVAEYKQFLEDQISSLEDAVRDAQIPDCYRVAVVGRFKVGKSSFVNKLVGERLAGVHTNPETAAISIFKYSEEARAEIEIVSAEEWQRLKDDHKDDPKNPTVKRLDRFLNFNERTQKKTKTGKSLPHVNNLILME